ncbi:ATP-binding cassette domain-containing protein [Streptomyces longwoodensis]
MSGIATDTMVRIEDVHKSYGAGAAAADPRERVELLLSLVGLADHAGRRPGELSGGRQQRVAIARVLADNPSLLIADEPTDRPDADTGHAVMELVRTVVRSEGVAALVATHDATLLDLADRVLELSDGEIAERGERADAVGEG